MGLSLVFVKFCFILNVWLRLMGSSKESIYTSLSEAIQIIEEEDLYLCLILIPNLILPKRGFL